MCKDDIAVHSIDNTLRLSRISFRILHKSQQKQAPRPEPPRSLRSFPPNPPVFLLVVEDIIQIVLHLADNPLVA